MSNSELKSKVMERLEEIEEVSLLEDILALIEEQSLKSSPFIIPDSHKADLEISLAEKKSGQVVSNEIVKERVEKWLYR